MGLEPMLGPWKGHVLPLHHTRLKRDFCSPFFVGAAGFEPTTFRTQTERASRAAPRPEYFANNITITFACLVTICQNRANIFWQLILGAIQTISHIKNGHINGNMTNICFQKRCKLCLAP